MPEFMNNSPMNKFGGLTGYRIGDYVFNLRELNQLTPEEQDIIINQGQPLDFLEYNRLKVQSENQNQGMGQPQTPTQNIQPQQQMNYPMAQNGGMQGLNFSPFQQGGGGILGNNLMFSNPQQTNPLSFSPQNPTMPTSQAPTPPNAIQGMANGVVANNPAIMGVRAQNALSGMGKPGGTDGIWDDKSKGFLSNLWDKRSNNGEMTAGLTGIAGTIGNLLFNKPPTGESDKLLSDTTKSITDSITDSGRNLKQQFRPEYYQRSKEINAIQAAGGANRLPAGAIGNQIADTGYQHWRAYYDRLTPAIDSTVKSTTKSVTDSLGQNLAINAYTRYMANQNAFNWKQGLLGGALNIGMNMLMPGSGMLSRGIGGVLGKLF